MCNSGSMFPCGCFCSDHSGRHVLLLLVDGAVHCPEGQAVLASGACFVILDKSFMLFGCEVFHI